MAQMDAGPWLDLGMYKRFTVFICHATGGRCEDWDPFKGANKVMLHRELDGNLYDGPPTGRVYRRTRLTVDPPRDEHEMVRQVEEDALPLENVLRELRYDKLGGGAVWIHNDATPAARSGQPMRMTMQVTTDLVRFDITPRGMAYVFVERNEDRVRAAYLLWQGS